MTEGQAGEPAGQRPASANDGPGALRGEVWLTVQTHQAQRLVTGRRADEGKPAIIGLMGFAALIRPIWDGARADDPYADWWLVRIYEALAQAEEALRETQASVLTRLEALSAIEKYMKLAIGMVTLAPRSRWFSATWRRMRCALAARRTA